MLDSKALPEDLGTDLRKELAGFLERNQEILMDLGIEKVQELFSATERADLDMETELYRRLSPAERRLYRDRTIKGLRSAVSANLQALALWAEIQDRLSSVGRKALTVLIAGVRG